MCSFTVNPTSTPRPETSSGARSEEPQVRQIGPGGCWKDRQSAHRRNLSTPSEPLTQKNSDSGTSIGKGGDTAATL